MFEEPILAWNYAPVIPSLYYEFRESGKKPIPKGNYSAVFNDYEDEEFGGKTRKLESVPIVEDNTLVLKILNAEWNHYKNYNGIQLSEITHKEGSPWRNAITKGLNTRLDDNDIKAFFIKEITKLMKQDENNSKS